MVTAALAGLAAFLAGLDFAFLGVGLADESGAVMVFLPRVYIHTHTYIHIYTNTPYKVLNASPFPSSQI